MTRTLHVFKILLASILFVSSLFHLSEIPHAYAEEPAAEDESASGYEDWDSLIEAFLTENKCYNNNAVAIGYYNTVTGEEHYYRGDVYMETGSLYKVPLNMVYAERIYKGEMDFDTKINGTYYSTLQRGSLTYSNNGDATTLWRNLGGYHYFRELIAPYMGVDPDTVDHIYYKNRYFTAEQVIHCLRILYEDQERFPGIIDCLLEAEPSNYFNYHPQEYQIAHKYGYIKDDAGFSICDCGICYTDEPILITMFTSNVRHPNHLLADFCTLACNYAQQSYTARQEAILEAIPTETEQTIEPEIPEPSTTPEPILFEDEFPDDANTVSDTRIFSDSRNVKLFVLISILAAAAIVAVFIMAFKKKLNLFWGLMAVLFAYAAAGACIIGMTDGTLYTKTEGNPQDTVVSYLDNYISGNYSIASEYLTDHSVIGFISDSADPNSVRLLECLKNSYSYQLYGDCRIDGLEAKQRIVLTYLKLSDIKSDLLAKTNETAQKLVEELHSAKIYDENGNYLESFTNAAYDQALDEVLSDCEKYYTTVPIDLTLSYSDKQWLLNMSPELLSASCGGE